MHAHLCYCCPVQWQVVLDALHRFRLYYAFGKHILNMSASFFYKIMSRIFALILSSISVRTCIKANIYWRETKIITFSLSSIRNSMAPKTGG